MGGQGSAGEMAQHVQQGSRLFSVEAGERSDPSALVNGAAKSQKGCRQNLLPVGSVLVAKEAEHGVQVVMHPSHGVRLGIVGGCEVQPNASPPESLLHHLGPEVRRIVRVHLQWMTKPRIQHLQSAEYLFACCAVEQDGLKPFAEDIFQCEEI